ncbi:DUF4442 domain-containing protein [Catenovulum adriaticum]|uniref:DUF4442 domain-containing protein n=1 Tax=Catenovulum adriaticum TaxID=2984846 RepID=A0ABY7AIH0_9ALTE|nr:DUF4442 domain-containing protein [Catenovulum sp. TS8]WAJ69249.1 DUF4442 domain-containing protein [Catenovulum sp. TS8]
MDKVFKYPNFVKFALNIWPPFLCCGIRFTEIAKDFSYARVELKHWKLNLNANRTQYGGSIFSMTDPVYSLLLMASLGKKYHVWDKSADVDFIHPGRETLVAEAFLNSERLNEIRKATESGGKIYPTFTFHVKDKHGQLVAQVNRTLYVRLKAKYRPKTVHKGEL